MLKPHLPSNEADRLRLLESLNILDTPPEERFDRLTRIAQHILQVPITLVSLLDAERQWFKSRQGLNAPETPREISFCGHAILGTGTMIVPDAMADARFADNPLVIEEPKIRFYAGAPLRLSNGLALGTLCGIDYKPRQVSPEQLAALQDLAQCVIAEIEQNQHQKSMIDLLLVQARYVSIIESSANAVISTTMDGSITSWNPASERLFGYSAEEVMGQSVQKILARDQISEEKAHLERLRRGEHIAPFESTYLTKEGRSVAVAVHYSPILDSQDIVIGVSQIMDDISQKKQTEAALEKSTQLVHSIVGTVVDGIITINEQGTILSFNTAAERLFGYHAQEIIGTNVKQLMPEPYASAHDGYLSRYLTTHKSRIIGIGREVIGLRKDDSTFPMDLAVSEMRHVDQTLFVGIVRDITDRKQMERMKSEFVSTVSHELRTPLTSIRGALGLIMGRFAEALPNTIRLLLEVANRNAERLTLLINDLLDLEKIESAQFSIRFQKLDLVTLTRQAIMAHEGYGQQHTVGIRLTETLESAEIQGDENRLLQVLANLLSNAIKYSKSSEYVDVTVQKHDHSFRVRVRDFGAGIPSGFRDRMFQRFSQADSSDTRKKGGTGLGLSIAKSIIERHGGTLDFTSEEGVGTEFFFDLPMCTS